MALFTATFCITLAHQTHGFRVPGLRGADLWLKYAPASVSSPNPGGANTGALREARVAAALPSAVETPEATATPAAPPEEPRYGTQIEAALTEDDSQTRAVAIRELAQAPADEAIATLEQVLRTDSDPENRALALQELLRMPSGNAVGSAKAQVLREFVDDADGRVAALAREGMQQAAMLN